jgi:hypothetical protein
MNIYLSTYMAKPEGISHQMTGHLGRIEIDGSGEIRWQKEFEHVYIWREFREELGTHQDNKKKRADEGRDKRDWNKTSWRYIRC